MIGQRALDTTRRQVLNTTDSVGGQILLIIGLAIHHIESVHRQILS